MGDFMAEVRIEDLSVIYKAKKKKGETIPNVIAVDKVNALFEKGSFNVIIGYSGCGKTSLLKAIADILPYDGYVFLDNTELTNLPLIDRNISFVSQNYVLYPNLTIFDNIQIKFTPNEEFDLGEWYQRRNKILLSEKALHEQKMKEKYVEKVNKDELFNYNIALVNEESGILTEEHVASDFEFVIGIRPEFVGINKGYIKGEIYGVLPTGMEVTLKLRVDNYLLTSVIFGGVTHKIGKKVNISFDNNAISLFDRVTGKLISTGSISKV